MFKKGYLNSIFFESVNYSLIYAVLLTSLVILSIGFSTGMVNEITLFIFIVIFVTCVIRIHTSDYLYHLKGAALLFLVVLMGFSLPFRSLMFRNINDSFKVYSSLEVLVSVNLWLYLFIIKMGKICKDSKFYGSSF